MDGSRFCGPDAYIIFGAPFTKKNINYEYKIRYEGEHLFRAPTQGFGRGPYNWEALKLKLH